MEKNFRKFIIVILGLILILNIAFNKDLYSRIPISLIFGSILGFNLAKLASKGY